MVWWYGALRVSRCFFEKMLGSVSLFCGLIRYIDVTVAESESFGCTEGWS